MCTVTIHTTTETRERVCSTLHWSLEGSTFNSVLQESILMMTSCHRNAHDFKSKWHRQVV